jgi:hypothetical protein
MENIEFHPHMLIIFYLKCLKYPVFYLQIIININIKNAKKKKTRGRGGVEDCDWITPSAGLATPNDDSWVGQTASSTLRLVRFPF